MLSQLDTREETSINHKVQMTIPDKCIHYNTAALSRILPMSSVDIDVDTKQKQLN